MDVGESAKDTIVTGQLETDTTFAAFPTAVVPTTASLLYGATVLTEFPAMGVVVTGDPMKGRFVMGMLVATLVDIGTVVTGSSLMLTEGELMSLIGDWLVLGESLIPVATVLA